MWMKKIHAGHLGWMKTILRTGINHLPTGAGSTVWCIWRHAENMGMRENRTKKSVLPLLCRHTLNNTRGLFAIEGLVPLFVE